MYNQKCNYLLEYEARARIAERERDEIKREFRAVLKLYVNDPLDKKLKNAVETILIGKYNI